jgi:hypothetical protein
MIGSETIQTNREKALFAIWRVNYRNLPATLLASPLPKGLPLWRHLAVRNGDSERGIVGEAHTRIRRAGCPALEFGHSGVPIPVDLPEGETKIARQFTAGEESELIESRRDG